jgi:hypothetical protein
VRKEDVSVEMTEGVLTVHGDKKSEREEKKERSRYIERARPLTASMRPTRTASSRCGSGSGRRPNPGQSPSSNAAEGQGEIVEIEQLMGKDPRACKPSHPLN